MKSITIATTIFAFFISLSLSAEFKADKDVSYGPHERNVLDVYWDTKFKNAPIVFTIHGGGFKNGSKAYCNKDMIKLYMTKGCIVVSPNYRLVGKGEPVTKDDCAMDTAMAVAHIQANAKKYGGDPTKIVSTGASAGGYISAWIAYQKNWEWPANAKHKPKKLNIVGWFGNSPSSQPARNTVSNSRPLAECSVMTLTKSWPSASLSSITRATCSRKPASESNSAIALTSSLRFSSRPGASADLSAIHRAV